MEKTNASRSNPQIIYSWSAPLRPYKKRTAGVMRFYLALALLLSLIVFFFGEKLLVLPIAAITFLFYILTTSRPQTVSHKLTKFGVETTGLTFRWELLSHFYFTKKFDYHQLVIVSVAPYFYHLYLVVKDEAVKEDLVGILSEYLIYQENPQKTFSEKLAEWLTRLMPETSAAT